MGRTVIASNHGGTVETVAEGRTGWLAPPGDAEAWARAMAHSIESGADRRRTMGEAGLARARQLYPVSAMCRSTLAAYERVLEARR